MPGPALHFSAGQMEGVPGPSAPAAGWRGRRSPSLLPPYAPNARVCTRLCEITGQVR